MRLLQLAKDSLTGVSGSKSEGIIGFIKCWKKYILDRFCSGEHLNPSIRRPKDDKNVG